MEPIHPEILGLTSMLYAQWFCRGYNSPRQIQRQCIMHATLCGGWACMVLSNSPAPSRVLTTVAHR